jgi:hypothetical protein
MLTYLTSIVSAGKTFYGLGTGWRGVYGASQSLQIGQFADL